MNQNPFEAPTDLPDEMRTVDPIPDDGACPICRTYAGMRRPELLYGYDVCSTCSWNFAWSRRAAFVFDSILFYALWTVLSLWLMTKVEGLPLRQTQLIITGVFLLCNLLFYLKDGFNGRSFGKLLFGLAVINRTSGNRAGFLTSIKRHWPFWMLTIVFQMLNVLVMAFQQNPLEVNWIALAGSMAIGLCHLTLHVLVAILLGSGYRWGDGFGQSKVIWLPYAKSPVFRPNLRKADHLA